MKMLIVSILTLTASIGFAMPNVFCWKGFSQADQDNNASLCQSQRQPGQKCETNAWNTGAAVYDVCLQGTNHQLSVVSCLKGFSDKEQKANLAQCELQISSDQVCETSMWVTGAAAYDVCIMQ